MSTSDTQDRLAKLSLRERIGYGLGDAGFNFYWAIIGSWLVFYYTEVYGASAKAMFWVIIISKLFDACTDPIMGAIADKTETRWGKFRPYLFIGAFPLMGAAILTMTTPDFGEWGKIVWAFITYNLLMMAYTVVSTPYSSLSGVITADPHERNTINSFRFFFAYLINIFVGAATLGLAQYFGDGDRYSQDGWQSLMMLYSAIATLFFLVTFFTTKERIKPPKDQNSDPKRDLKDLFKNRPWILLFVLALIIMVTFTLRGGSAGYYFKYFVERPDMLGAYLGLQSFGLMIGALAAAPLIKLINKTKLLIFCMGIVGILSIAFTFVPKPDGIGVYEISSNNSITLQASDLLGKEYDNGIFQWTKHEAKFWIFKDRKQLPDSSASIELEGFKGATISVKWSSTDGQDSLDSYDMPPEILIMFILNILISLFLGPKAPITWSMYADAADYNEWKTGRRATAMTFSATTFSQKVGSTIGSLIMLGLLWMFGFSTEAVQNNASVTSIVMMQTLVPGIFALISIYVLRKYDLDGEKLEKIQKELKERNA